MSRAVDVQEPMERRRLYAPERSKGLSFPNLTFYNGIGYLTGATASVLVGLARSAAKAERGEIANLHLNRALNQSGSVSRTYTNRLGVIAMLCAGSESFVFSETPMVLIAGRSSFLFSVP
ncbi:hypothetical protein E2562_034967 [Oryza meyeriana var. granulata]|uniref:Uncharacterized protein n=1 Tax=Oryza meyeriana var. granulata TaxID=110450 RepID=A0A6G1BPT3_9ORYZ|nr:hypothetical protein E2562_034967 [Oryza meyeriana var. granulata]